MQDRYDLVGDALNRVTRPTWWLLARMEQYVNAAILQRRRIDEVQGEIEALADRLVARDDVEEDLQRATNQLLSDVHFYVISVDQVRRLFERLRGTRESWPDGVSVLWKARKVALERFRDMRDVLEHADEQIVGGLQAGYGLSATFVNFADNTIDVGPQSLELVTRTWEQLMAAVQTMPIQASADDDHPAAP